jgi:hypothetical protein
LLLKLDLPPTLTLSSCSLTMLFHILNSDIWREVKVTILLLIGRDKYSVQDAMAHLRKYFFAVNHSGDALIYAMRFHHLRNGSVTICNMVPVSISM